MMAESNCKMATNQTRLRVYIAGAYSADNVIDVLDNMRRGIHLAYGVLQAGFAPFAPWLDYQFSLVGPTVLEQYYEYSMAWLEVADAMIIVPCGANLSNGTQAEIARARELGIPIFNTIPELQTWATKKKSNAQDRQMRVCT